MNNENTYKEIADELLKCDLHVTASDKTYSAFKQALSAKLNEVITTDFSRLISILYRLDISEKKLTQSLSKAEETSASDIIAEMIIQRQLQKIEARKKFRSDHNASDEERW